MIKPDFTQAKLAQFLGCTQSSISQWQIWRRSKGQQGHCPSDKIIYRAKQILNYLKKLEIGAADKQRCQVIRKNLGLTQGDVALYLGVKPSSVSIWENGKEPRNSKTRIRDGIEYLQSIIPTNYNSRKAA